MKGVPETVLMKKKNPGTGTLPGLYFAASKY
jgi:hypothetical protein